MTNGLTDQGISLYSVVKGLFGTARPEVLGCLLVMHCGTVAA